MNHSRHDQGHDMKHKLSFLSPGAVLSICLALHCAWALPAFASTNQHGQMELNEQLWYADNGQQHALFGGVGGAYAWHPAWKGALEVLHGQYDSAGDTEKHTRCTARVDWRFWRMFSAGIGGEYFVRDSSLKAGWQWDTDYPEEKQRNADIFGPCLQLCAGDQFGASPFTWSLLARWMFLDLGELKDLDYDGSHYQLKAAVGAGFSVFRLSLGYSYLRYRDYPPRISNKVAATADTEQGPYAELSILF